MLTVTNISKSFGERVLFSGLTFNVGARERIAVIGPNGSGKTTLFEILAGNLAPDSGSVCASHDITIGYARQEVSPFSTNTLMDEVAHGPNKITGLAHRIRILQDALSEETDAAEQARLLREMGELQHRFEAAGGYNIDHEAEVILCGLGFTRQDFLHPLNEFSGGWLMRAALARLLVVNPDMVLLDEPTNHLDLETCLWFEEYLKSYQGAVLVTSHDRAFLNRVAGKVISIEKDDVIFFDGTYDEFAISREKDREQTQAAAKRQEQQLKKEMRFIEKFRYKATKAAQVQSRIKQLDKIERIVVPRSTKKIHFAFPEPPRGGDEVIDLRHIVKSYNGKVVYPDLNLTLRRGNKVALVGPNGSGKTTLLKILAGVLPFDRGTRKLGHNIDVAYYAQHQLELLDPANMVLEEVRRVAPEETEQRLRGMLGAFLFSGDDVFKPVSVLSGGEKSRLAIAKMLVRPANFLLMDEPTNNLDISSREILSDALEAYHGTLCFITHDRTLIREIADRIIEIRCGVPLVYEGNYDEYLAWREAHPDDASPAVTGNGAAKKEISLRDLQRQRKIAEGELRNSYYRESSALKKKVTSVENELAAREAEQKELEANFGKPEFYKGSSEIAAATRRYQELKKIIPQLAAEWESLSLEAEQKKQEFEQARKEIEVEQSGSRAGGIGPLP